MDMPTKCDQSVVNPLNLAKTIALEMESFNVCFSSFAFLGIMSPMAWCLGSITKLLAKVSFKKLKTIILKTSQRNSIIDNHF